MIRTGLIVCMIDGTFAEDRRTWRDSYSSTRPCHPHRGELAIESHLRGNVRSTHQLLGAIYTDASGQDPGLID